MPYARRACRRPALYAAMTLCLIGAPANGGLVWAQEPASVFEFVSVRASEGGATSITWSRGGRFEARHVTLEALIRAAYRHEQWNGASGVISVPLGFPSTARFDITAIGPTEWTPAPNGEVPHEVSTMLRAVLEERFRVKAAFRMRSVRVQALRLPRRSAGLGPGLRPATGECAGLHTAAAPGEHSGCAPVFDRNGVEARGVSLDEVALLLSRFTELVRDAPIVNETALDGRFDLVLRIPPVRIGPRDVAIRDAVQQQLGLRLERANTLLPVLFVERAERPRLD
jgi:uncharacterized protein (TIGR03435 family)